MNIAEWLTSLLAPHLCAGCGAEGQSLCESCLQQLLSPHSVKLDRRGVSFVVVWAGTAYGGLAKEVISGMKFKRQKATARLLGNALDACVPRLPSNAVICPIPTAQARIRQRGYDQAVLMAQSFAAQRRLAYREVLFRQTQTRQVGSARQQRFDQLQGAFTVRKPARITGRPVVVVDDVFTTGATLVSATHALLEAGAQSVTGVVFARAK